MTAFSTDTHSSMDACPPLEDIAAFLDGRLSPEDREQITAHLASCERCYEIFIGAVHFQEDEGSALDTDEGDVVPFPFQSEVERTSVSVPVAPLKEKVRPRASRWLALAASLILVPALGYLAWLKFFSPPRIVLAEVIQPFQKDPGAFALVYTGDTPRGQDERGASERASFMAGVYLLDLRLAIEAEDLDRTKNRLQDLFLSLREVPFSEDLAKSYEDEYLQMKTSAELARLAPQILAREATIQEQLSIWETFSFGLWTEAGRLAALTHSPEFYEDSNNRRFLNYLFKEAPWAGDDLLEEVPNHLQAIRETWDSGKLTEAEYKTLAAEFEGIIKAYDTPDDF